MFASGFVIDHDKSSRSGRRIIPKVNAIDAPFEAKDRLKSRGYRWDSALCFWWKAIAEADKEAEEAWLLSDVYVGHGSPAFLTVTAMERHR